MPNYIFLDTSILKAFTVETWVAQLSRFLRSSNFTVVITSLLLTELYNPGWSESPEQDRNLRITNFLGQHPYVIADNKAVLCEEMHAFPNSLASLPINLHSSNLVPETSGEALLLLLRRHPVFLRQGMDIAEWDAHYSAAKNTWLEDAQHILDDACTKGTLRRDSSGRLMNLHDYKETFLQTLDLRHLGHFSADECEALGPKIVDLVMGGTSQLPAIRLTSLAYWYSHVERDRANLLRQRGSDIGDYWHMSLLPYCAVYTTDDTMARLAGWILNDTSHATIVLNHGDLRDRLNNLG